MGAESLPEVARLRADFDVARLVADHQLLRGLRTGLRGERRCLSLRSPGGDPELTDPGPHGLLEFADTPWLSRAAYLPEALAAIPAPLRGVRLVELGPGSTGTGHLHHKHGLPWGIARLHLPITVPPGARLTLAGRSHHWRPGSLWFGDFSQPHQVVNDGHDWWSYLVIDTTVTWPLLQLFPPEVYRQIDKTKILFTSPVVPLPSDVGSYRCRFAMPASFADWREPGGQLRMEQPRVPAETDIVDGALVLVLAGRPAFALIHLGMGEFRLGGWTEERTLQILPDRSATQIVLRTRQGGAVRELVCPAQALNAASVAGRR